MYFKLEHLEPQVHLRRVHLECLDVELAGLPQVESNFDFILDTDTPKGQFEGVKTQCGAESLVKLFLGAGGTAEA